MGPGQTTFAVTPRTSLATIALAPREQDVLRMMAGDGSYTDIAHELGLQPEAVTSYRQPVRRKLGATSRGDAVAVARENGLLPGPAAVYHDTRKNEGL